MTVYLVFVDGWIPYEEEYHDLKGVYRNEAAATVSANELKLDPSTSETIVIEKWEVQ